MYTTSDGIIISKRNNIHMYVNKGRFVNFYKRCELTYFAVPLNPFDYESEFAVFSDELAASMFAASIHSEVMCDYHVITLWRK